MAHSLWVNFAGMHILYQVALIAIAAFMIVMSLTFIYNMLELVFTFTKDMLKMAYELLEKGVKSLYKAIDKLFMRKPAPVSA